LGDTLLRCRFVAAPHKKRCRQTAGEEQDGKSFEAAFLMAV